MSSKNPRRRPNVESERIVDEGARVDVVSSHPDPLRHFTEASAILGLSEPIDDRSLEVTGLRRWVPKLPRAKRPNCSTKSVVIILCAMIGLSADTLRNGSETPNQSSKAVSDRG